MNAVDLNSSERIIRRVGGQSALAGLLGRRQSTVEHWASTGRVPAQWHGPLMSLARQKGIVLEAKDFVETETHSIAPAGGKLGVLLVGLGAVASTFISGVEHARRGTGRPIGSPPPRGAGTAKGGGAGAARARGADRRFLEDERADAGGVRRLLRQAASWHEREANGDEDGGGGRDPRGHSGVQGRERLRGGG